MCINKFHSSKSIEKKKLLENTLCGNQESNSENRSKIIELSLNNFSFYLPDWRYWEIKREKINKNTDIT